MKGIKPFFQLLRLVNSMSAAERLSAAVQPTMQDRDLAGIVKEICGEAEPLARLLKLELRVRCVPERLVCALDEEAIRQVLFQLLSNAFKFTDAGGRVTVSLTQQDGQTLLEVTDTGCGMDDIQLGTMFERYRHPELRDPPPCGLGLGLALCFQIAEEHGGCASCASCSGCASK